MLSVLLSLLIALAQALVCPGVACQFRATDPDAPGTGPTHHARGGPSLDDALAWMGQAAIEAAFSGVVQVGDGAGHHAASPTRTC